MTATTTNAKSFSEEIADLSREIGLIGTFHNEDAASFSYLTINDLRHLVAKLTIAIDGAANGAAK